jgi:hypothetical protein
MCYRLRCARSNRNTPHLLLNAFYRWRCIACGLLKGAL